MKAFTACLVVLTVLSSPALAFSVDISIPNLTWPDETPAPISQGCVGPAQLDTPDCPVTE